MSSHVNGIAAMELGSSSGGSGTNITEEQPTASYSTYQNDVYRLGLVKQKPVLSTHSSSWPALAKASASPEAWGYLEGGGGSSETMAANRAAFNKWKIIPRMMTGNNERTLKTALFGKEQPSPFIMAPVGVNRIFHTDGEVAVAKACAAAGVPYSISTASSTSIEDIAAAGGPDATRYYQLYWPRDQDNDVTLSLLSRAWEAGCRVLMVTVDTWGLGWRPADLDNTYVPFFFGIGCQIGLSDPVFRKKYTALTHKTIEEDISTASMAWLRTAFSGKSRTWSDLAFLRENWRGSLVIKGIQSPADALRAVDAGADGVVVSNHGGRQYDGAVGSLTQLPEIAAALRERKTASGEAVTILFDSGVRCGADALKALALGAHGVMLGRPVMYGLTAAGREGAEHVLRCLLADLELNLAVMGYTGISDISASDLKYEPYA